MLWCPGHSGIRGNKLADGMAKAAALAVPPTDPVPTAAWFTAQARSEGKRLIEKWWVATQPTGYKALGLGP